MTRTAAADTVNDVSPHPPNERRADLAWLDRAVTQQKEQVMANQQQPNEPVKRDPGEKQRTSQPPLQQPEKQPDLGKKEHREENIPAEPKRANRPS
jgi:hypothetical protein